MSKDIYLQPCGFLYGQTARQAKMNGKAGLVGGQGPAFGAVKILRRQGQEELVSYDDISKSDESSLQNDLHSITQKRKPIAGYDFSEPLIMGIVNTTPDSFSDGGDFFSAENAIAHGRLLAQEGAHILDIGGESTRPGADEVDREEELKRTLPVVEALSKEGFCVSIDSRKSEIMRQACSLGAAIINDVSALQFDKKSTEIALEADVPVVLMHAQGTPENMQDDPQYENVVFDIYDALAGLIETAQAAGIKKAHIIADPGIGFGKTCEHNISLMQSLSVFHGLGVPLLVGASRKRFLGEITGEGDPKKRIVASVAAAIWAARQGVHILRVHDVSETVHGLKFLKNMQM